MKFCPRSPSRNPKFYTLRARDCACRCEERYQSTGGQVHETLTHGMPTAIALSVDILSRYAPRVRKCQERACYEENGVYAELYCKWQRDSLQ